jgi:poly(A) polymerase
MDHHRDNPESPQDGVEPAGPSVYETLAAAGYQVSLRSFSAIDQYLGLAPLPFTWIETDADITTLARFFDRLRFPGVDLADGALEAGGRSWYFRCLDLDEAPIPGESFGPAFTLLSLNQDWSTRRFQDPCGVYPIIRLFREGPAKRASPGEKLRWMTPRPGTDRYRAAMEGALILARYGMEEGRGLG